MGRLAVLLVAWAIACNVVGVLGQHPSGVHAVQARAMLEQILATIPGVDQASIDAIGSTGCPAEGVEGWRCAWVAPPCAA